MPAVDTSTECFDLPVGPGTGGGLGQLQAFGRYWVWAYAVPAGLPALRLLEWTDHGLADLATERVSLHRVQAGAPHTVEGLFGYWLISDADHQWFQIPTADGMRYVLIAGGGSGANRRHAIVWYCPECGAPLGEPTSLTHDGSPPSFLETQARAVQQFNRDLELRTCTKCAAVHPEAYPFRGAAAPFVTIADTLPPPAMRTQFGAAAAHADDVQAGSPRLVEVDGQQIGLVRNGDQIHAIANACPHKGGPLAFGQVRHGEITCPWHRFRFDLATGASLTNPALCASVYRVAVQGDDVIIQRPGPSGMP